MKALLGQMWSGKQDLALIALVMGVLVVLFVPVPPGLLDFLLVINISIALLILLVTFFIETPLNFSTFPTILLLSTLFRLSLNVSATRLILKGSDAGQVINAIGEFVVGGSYVVGIVVFLILVVVQYVVVTAGAQRVAEVAARFTLDSMPGKQMSIDADMNMGLIDETEARRRRAQVEREANFYGAMDGATKFVKGDAIAGIVIILTNIVGGLAIGIAQLELSWGEAVQHFTLMTIGDGIVTQIPSLVIAVATGIIITRAASDGQLGSEIPKQVLANPKALVLVGATLGGVMLLPGFPKLPVAFVLCLLGALAYFALKAKPSDASLAEDQAEQAAQLPGDALQQLMRIDPIEVRYGSAIGEMLAQSEDFDGRIGHLRRQFAQSLGFVVPRVQTGMQVELPAGAYEIHFHGYRVARGDVLVGRLLAINPGGTRTRLEGEETRDPAYGLPAQWIAQEARQSARSAGYTVVDPDTVVVTHLSEMIKRNAADLVSRADTERMLQRLREQHASLADDLVPSTLSYSEVHKVLQLLLREQVSIRNMEAIAEALLEAGRTTKDLDTLVERVRERLGAAICQEFRDAQGELHVLTLSPEIERSVLASARSGETRAMVFGELGQLDGFMKNLAKHAESMMGRNLVPVLLCPSSARRAVQSMLHRSMPHVAVLGLNEVPAAMPVRAFASVQAGQGAVYA